MITRRKPHTPAAPRLDSAPDADELYPCTVDRLNREAMARLNGTKPEPTPYDMLIAPPGHGSRDVATFAAREAANLCGRCPVRDTCLTENSDEEWVAPIVRILNAEAAA